MTERVQLEVPDAKKLMQEAKFFYLLLLHRVHSVIGSAIEMTKYILVSGGVVSGIGKGVIGANNQDIARKSF